MKSLIFQSWFCIIMVRTMKTDIFKRIQFFFSSCLLDLRIFNILLGIPHETRIVEKDRYRILSNGSILSHIFVSDNFRTFRYFSSTCSILSNEIKEKVGMMHELKYEEERFWWKYFLFFTYSSRKIDNFSLLTRYYFQ